MVDESIGGLTIDCLSDQPQEFMDKIITIVGYPGDKIPTALYTHSGPIKDIDENSIAYY